MLRAKNWERTWHKAHHLRSVCIVKYYGSPRVYSLRSQEIAAVATVCSLIRPSNERIPNRKKIFLILVPGEGKRRSFSNAAVAATHA